MTSQNRFVKNLLRSNIPPSGFRPLNPNWYISAPSQNKTIKIGDKYFNVDDVCKVKVFDCEVDVTPFLLATYKSLDYYINQSAVTYQNIIGTEALNKYANSFKKQQLKNASELEFYVNMSKELENSKKLRDWSPIACSLIVRLCEISHSNEIFFNGEKDIYTDIDLYQLSEHMEYVIPEIINAFGLIFTGGVGKGQLWNDGEHFESCACLDMSEKLNIDNTSLMSTVIAYLFFQKVNEEYLPSSRKLKLYSLNTEELLEKSFKVGSELKMYLKGFGSSEKIVENRFKPRGPLCDVDKEVLAIYFGVDYTLENLEKFEKSGICRILRNYSSGAPRKHTINGEKDFECLDNLAFNEYAINQIVKDEERAEKYKQEAQRDRIDRIEAEREVKKVRKEAKKNEETIQKLSGEVEKLREKKDTTGLIPIEKFNKVEEESKYQAERIKELETMMGDIVEENRDKSNRLSDMEKQNKKLVDMLQKYGLLDEEDTVDNLIKNNHPEISLNEKVECLNQFKIAIGGGWDQLPDRLAALGVCNIIRIGTVNEADKAAKYDLLVIGANFISHTLAYKLIKQAESFGAAKMYFSGTNASKLVDYLYALLEE